MKLTPLLFLSFFVANLHADSRFSSLGNIVFDPASNQSQTINLNTSGQLAIGATAASNTLTVAGNTSVTGQLQSTNLKTKSVKKSSITVSANYIVDQIPLILADTSSANLTITLPYAANVSGRVYEIKKTSLIGYLDINVAGGGNVEKRSTYRLTKDQSSFAYGKFMSNGVEWYKLAENGGVYSERGLSFDGVDDDVVVNSNALSFEKDNSFSISVWARGTIGTFLTKRVPDNPGYLFGFRGGGEVRLALSNSWGTNILEVYSNSSWNDNNHHHFLVTYSGLNSPSSISIYVNGSSQSLVTQYNSLTGTIVNSDPFQLGVASFNGSLDDPSIWNKALTQAEVTEIYNNGRPTDLLKHSASANLVGYWKLGDGDTYPYIKDWSTSGNTGTMTNMTSASITEDTP